MRHHDHWRSQQIYRLPRQGRLMGVCAGLADHFGWNVTLTRMIAIIALLWLHGMALVAYLALGLLLPTRTDDGHDRDTYRDYWRSARRSPDNSFRDTSHRCSDLQVRSPRMGGHVTSSRHDLERAFRDLEH